MYHWYRDRNGPHYEAMLLSRKIKKGVARTKRKIKGNKKQENLFLVLWVYTDCDLVLSSSRDFPRLKLLQFDFRWDLFLLCLPSLNILTTLQVYVTVVTLLEHSVEEPLEYRWLIRHFGDIYCRQGRHIFISIIGPSDLKYADRDTATPSQVVESMLMALSLMVRLTNLSRNNYHTGDLLSFSTSTAPPPILFYFASEAVNVSRLAHFITDRLMTEVKMWRHSATMYIAEAKSLMSHQYPNGPYAECSRRRGTQQRSRAPNKRVDSADIEEWQRKNNRIRSKVKL